MSQAVENDEKIIDDEKFEALIKPNDWLNRSDRGTLLLLGLDHTVLLAAVKRLRTCDYNIRYDERLVSTGSVDENDKPIKIKKITIRYLDMLRSRVPSFVHQFKGLVDHHVLREARFRRYEADRMSEELENNSYYGNSSCEVRSFVKHAKKFAYNLSKIPVAARRKEALRSVVKAFGDIVYENTNERGVMPTDNDEDFLMYSVYMGVKSIVTGDCFLTKILHTLLFSEDTSCPFRFCPTTRCLHYPSRRAKREVSVELPSDLYAEVTKLQSIRAKQSTTLVFINPNRRGAYTYNALTKWANRYSKNAKKNNGVGH